VTIADFVGGHVVCPKCKHKASVEPAAVVNSNRKTASVHWAMLRCSGFCGAYLERMTTPAVGWTEPEPEPVPAPTPEKKRK